MSKLVMSYFNIIILEYNNNYETVLVLNFLLSQFHAIGEL